MPFIPDKKQPKPGYLKSTAQKTKQYFKEGLGTTAEGYKQVQEPGIMNKVVGGLKLPVGIGRAAFSPVAAAVEPVVEPTIGRGIQYTANKISDIPAVQKFATSDFGQKVDPYLEATALTGELAGYVTTGLKSPKTVKGIPSATRRVGTAAEEAAGRLKTATGAVGERLPLPKGAAGQLIEGIPAAAKAATRPLKRENIINSQIAKAFNLAPVEDVAVFKNIAKMDLGEYMVKNNLLKGGVEETKQALKAFNETNYKNVRSEIAKVNTKYTQQSIPRYTQTLETMLADVAEIPGLESKAAEISGLLKKKNPTLTDVQRVKELIDDTYSIYKKSGEPAATIKAQGLDTMRKDIRSFIETEVKKNTGADIRNMNKDVAATRELMDAIERRAGKEATRSGVMSSTGYGLGGYAIGGAPGVAAGLLVKYIVQNPEMRLRFATILSKIEPKARQTIINQIKSNKIGPEATVALTELQKAEPGILQRIKDAYKNSPMSDEGGYFRMFESLPKKAANPKAKPKSQSPLADTGNAYLNRLNKYEAEALKKAKTKKK